MNPSHIPTPVGERPPHRRSADARARRSPHGKRAQIALWGPGLSLSVRGFDRHPLSKQHDHLAAFQRPPHPTFIHQSHTPNQCPTHAFAAWDRNGAVAFVAAGEVESIDGARGPKNDDGGAFNCGANTGTGHLRPNRVDWLDLLPGWRGPCKRDGWDVGCWCWQLGEVDRREGWLGTPMVEM